MGEDKQAMTSTPYAQRLGGGRRAEAEAAAARAARQAEIAAVMDRRNEAAGGFAARIGTSRERDQRITEQDEANRLAEQARVSQALEKRIALATGSQELTYSERLTVITLSANQISTKDLRSPTERDRDERAARDARSSSFDSAMYADG